VAHAITVTDLAKAWMNAYISAARASMTEGFVVEILLGVMREGRQS
jgi:hypothetical protein